jgi:hypothetical protein
MRLEQCEHLFGVSDMKRDDELDVAAAREDAGQGGNLPADASARDRCGEDVAAVRIDDAVVAGQLE